MDLNQQLQLKISEYRDDIYPNYTINIHDYRGGDKYSIAVNDYTKTVWIQKYDTKYYKTHYYHIDKHLRNKRINEILK